MGGLSGSLKSCREAAAVADSAQIQLDNDAGASSSAESICKERVVQALILAVACGAANTLFLGAGILKREDVERLGPMVNVTALE